MLCRVLGTWAQKPGHFFFLLLSFYKDLIIFYIVYVREEQIWEEFTFFKNCHLSQLYIPMHFVIIFKCILLFLTNYMDQMIIAFVAPIWVYMCCKCSNIGSLILFVRKCLLIA